MFKRTQVPNLIEILYFVEIFDDTKYAVQTHKSIILDKNILIKLNL